MAGPRMALEVGCSTQGTLSSLTPASHPMVCREVSSMTFPATAGRPEGQRSAGRLVILKQGDPKDAGAGEGSEVQVL